MIAVAALAFPGAAVSSDGLIAAISVMLPIFLDSFFLAMFGLWLCPVGPCPLELRGINHDRRNPAQRCRWFCKACEARRLRFLAGVLHTPCSG